MNKQIVIATFLGASAAQCEDAFVKMAQAMKTKLDTAKTTLATEKTTLAALAASELTAYNTAKARSDAQVTLMAPFKTTAATALANWKKKNDAVTKATSDITAVDAVIVTKTAALTTAKAAVTAQDLKISAQKAIVTKLNAAVLEHTAEEQTMVAALATATTAESAASTASTAATTAKNAAITARAKTTAPKGTTQLKTEATTARDSAASALTTPTSEEASTFLDYKTKNMLFLKDTKTTADYLAACTFTDHTCKTYDNDPIKALWTASNSALSNSTTNKTNAKSAWDLKVTALANVMDLKNQADQKLLFATDQDTTAGSAITTLTGAETTAKAAHTTATGNKTTATTNKSTATSQLAQANLDLTRGQALHTKLVAALVPLTDAVVIAKYNEGLETAKKTGFEASKAAGNLNLSDFKTLSDMAAETVTRAKKKLDFDNGLTASALASKTLIDEKVTANATAITKNAADITAHAKKLAAAIATCKGVGYDKAQNAMKDFLAKQKADDAKAATVKSAYETKAAFATTGETNTECSFPVVTAGEAAKPRPKCKEGYCCGSAQKFMRDGTKIAVETCQKNKGVSTYTYYPPLPAKAIAEPTPETWRFQCISGAKQLVATATAALAATYMMA